MAHLHPYRRLTARCLAALTMIAATVSGTITACSDDAETAQPPAAAADAGASAAAEPKTLDAAKIAAQTVFDRFSGGDFAGAWELYTTRGKQAISQPDYVRLHEACARRGIAIQLSSARMQGTDKAVVIAKQLVTVQSYTMVYENDGWRLQPAREGLALYSRGAAKAIAAQKKARTCANA